MEDLNLEGTAKTPTVDFKSNGELLIKGRSIPENSIEFYKPIIDWISDYGNAPQSDTSVNIQLEYFNTSSSKCILDVFKKLESSYKKCYWVMKNDRSDQYIYRILYV